MRPTLADVLEFLQEGLKQGLRPATLKRQSAALATVIQSLEGFPLTKHPLVIRFLKGATALAPPQIHRFPSWNLNLVLQSLTTTPFEPVKNIPLRMLTMKTLFLVAITSARRVSELGALSTRKDLCVFHKDKVVLGTDPAFQPKRDSPFHLSQEICLPTFFPRATSDRERCWHKLDVRWSLRVYLKRTQSLRSTDNLFINIQNTRRGFKMSNAAISKTLKACIVEAYKIQKRAPPQGLTAHSIRGMATNVAFTHSASPLEVCRAATWSSLSTFTRHYKINTHSAQDAAFGRRVLQHVME